MHYGICALSVIPIRSKPADVAEMVSQLLFGETYEVIEKRRKWVKIRCGWDGYMGWIDAKQHVEISPKQRKDLEQNCAYALELVEPATTPHHYIPILMGSTLPQCDGINFRMVEGRYWYSGQLIKPTEVKITVELLLKIARRYLYAPYLWGGRSPFGIDCSGFSQTVFKMVGIALLRDASQQVEQGQVVDFFEEAQAGDLAFFQNDKGRVVHVGILLSDNQIIHASGQVRIDSLDRRGIYNHDLSKYTHELRIIKRFLLDQTKEG